MGAHEGLFRLIAVSPVWAIALFVLVFCTSIGILFVLADQKSGLFFNVSYSGTFGDLCLTIAVLIGTAVIQRGAPLPTWFSSIGVQTSWFVCCSIIGIILATTTTLWPTATWPDRYHNLVVVPLFLFIVPMTMLAVLYNGNRMEITAECFMVAIWAGLAYYDFRDNRLNQPEWLQKHFGIRLVHDRFERKL